MESPLQTTNPSNLRYRIHSRKTDTSKISPSNYTYFVTNKFDWFLTRVCNWKRWFDGPFVSGWIVSLIIHKGSLTTLSTYYVDRSSILVVPIPLLFDRIGSRNVIRSSEFGLYFSTVSVNIRRSQSSYHSIIHLILWLSQSK